jgi:hypothetical protein
MSFLNRPETSEKEVSMALDPPLPEDFPLESYSAIQKRISVDLGEAHPEARREFAGGWNALRFRYMACSEHDRDFTDLIRKHQSAPDRYGQERALYGFFVTGQSAIESLCYGLYTIASVLRSDKSPVRDQDLKTIKWDRTAGLFSSSFPGATLTTTLTRLVASSEFKAWRNLRNILTHRSTPGRGINIGGLKDGVIEWSDIVLNQDTTASRRLWLSTMVGTLLRTADDFTAEHLTKP